MGCYYIQINSKLLPLIDSFFPLTKCTIGVSKNYARFLKAQNNQTERSRNRADQKSICFLGLRPPGKRLEHLRGQEKK